MHLDLVKRKSFTKYSSSKWCCKRKDFYLCV